MKVDPARSLGRLIGHLSTAYYLYLYDVSTTFQNLNWTQRCRRKSYRSPPVPSQDCLKWFQLYSPGLMCANFPDRQVLILVMKVIPSRDLPTKVAVYRVFAGGRESGPPFARAWSCELGYPILIWSVRWIKSSRTAFRDSGNWCLGYTLRFAFLSEYPRIGWHVPRKASRFSVFVTVTVLQVSLLSAFLFVRPASCRSIGES